MNQILLWIYCRVLDVLHLSRLRRIAATKTRGKGLIFTLHQVNDTPVKSFAPNSILNVTPQFLEQTINKTLDEGFEIISLAEAVQRIETGKGNKPFAAFTFDDAYRDNLEIAYPIFKKYNLPFAIYVVSDYSSHQGEVWWVALEEIIARETTIEDPYIEGKLYETRTVRQKYSTFDALYIQMRNSDQFEQREKIKTLAARYNYDLQALSRRLIMSCDQLRELNKDPLVTLCAHTKSHFAIGALTENEAVKDISAGATKMAEELGEQPLHFSFPYGDMKSAGARDFKLLNQLGFKSGVTTRKGMIFNEHKAHLTALPRVSLNGKYQKLRYLEVFLSGLPFYLYNRFQKLNVQ